MDENKQYPLSLSESEDEKEPGSDRDRKPEKSGKPAGKDAGIFSGVYAAPPSGGMKASFRLVYAGPSVMPAPFRIGTAADGRGGVGPSAPDGSDHKEGMRDGPGASKADFFPKFCTCCGAKLFPRAKYCSECGKPVKRSIML